MMAKPLMYRLVLLVREGRQVKQCILLYLRTDFATPALLRARIEQLPQKLTALG